MNNFIFNRMSKENKRRIIAMILALTTTTSLTGCSSNNKDKVISSPSNVIGTSVKYDKDNNTLSNNLYIDYYNNDKDYINIFEEADLCLYMINLSEAIHKYQEKNSDKNLENIYSILNLIKNNPNFSLECKLTDSIDLENIINSILNNNGKNFDNLSNIVNAWLLEYGYAIGEDYCSELIRYIFDNIDMNTDGFNFKVVLKDTDVEVLDDLLGKNDNDLEIITGKLNRYRLDNSNILSAYVTMKYENSLKENGYGFDGYNSSRNDYLLKTFEIGKELILSSCNYYTDGTIKISPNKQLSYFIDKNIEEYISNVPSVDSEDNNVRSSQLYDYVLRNNEDISDILQRFETSLFYLKEINPDVDFNNLSVGDIISVPFKYKYIYSGMNLSDYEVKDGDSVISICNDFGVNYTDFLIANPQIANLDYIVAGDILHVPETKNKVYTSYGSIISEEEAKEYILEDGEKSEILYEEGVRSDNSISESIAERGFATGIDISSWQSNIDYNKIGANKNIDFAIIRANFLGYGDKEIHKDEALEENYKELTSRNIPVCFYVWLGLKEIENIETQANQALEELTRLQETYGYTDLPLIFIDYEDIYDGQGNVMYDMTSDPYTCGNSILKAISILESAGYRVGVYANTNDKTNLDNTVSEIKNYDTWIAYYHTGNDRYLDDTFIPTEGEVSSLEGNYANNYDIYQSTSTGIVDGIEEDYVDLNFMYVDYYKILEDNRKEIQEKRNNNNTLCSKYVKVYSHKLKI